MKLKRVFGLVGLIGMLSLSGCSVYNIKQPAEVKTADRMTVTAFLDTVGVTPNPTKVEEPKAPEPGLYDAMGLMCVNGFGQMRVLNANHFFDYDLLTEEDFDELNRITEFTNVNVKYYPNGYDQPNGSFSCFVYRIEDDYVYLGTAGHCIVGDKKQKNCKIMFYNREPISLSLLDYVFVHTFANKDGDYAMYRIPTSVIPKETLLTLKVVQYDSAFAEAVKSGDQVFSGNIYAKKDAQDYDITMPVYAPDEGFMAGPASRWSWMSTKEYILAKGKSIPGQSGSAYFDYRGYLVGLCSGGGNWEGTSYTIITRALHMEEMYDEFKKRDAEAASAETTEETAE